MIISNIKIQIYSSINNKRDKKIKAFQKIINTKSKL